MAEFEMKIEGQRELRAALDKLAVNIRLNGEEAIDKAAKDTAENIKVTFKGIGSVQKGLKKRMGIGMGFRDRTGALRASIKGGVLGTFNNGEVHGFIGAGDERIGSDEKPTKEYVKYVEFPEFRGQKDATNTSFLRPGLMMFARDIGKIVSSFLRADKLIGNARKRTSF